MYTLFSRVLTAVMLLFFVALPAQSQMSLVPDNLKPSTETAYSSESFAELMRQAAKNGVKIIVVDTQGNALSRTDTVKEDNEAPDDMSSLMKIQTSAVKFREILMKRLRSLPVAFEEVNYILKANSPTGELATYVKALFWSLVLFGIGYLVEREVYIKRIANRFKGMHKKENPVGYTEKLPFLIYRFFLRAIGVLISMVVAYVIGVTVFPPLANSGMQFTVTLINLAYLSCRIVTLLWRLVLAPYVCQYRIAQFSNKDAVRLYHWLWIVATIDICTVMLSLWVNELGLTYDVFALITIIFASFVFVLNFVLIVVNQPAISRAIRNGESVSQVGWLGRFVSSAWAPLAVVYLLFSWSDLTYRLVLELPLSKPAVLGAYAILITILVVYGFINYTIERFFQRATTIAEINRAMQAEESEAQDVDGSGDAGPSDPTEPAEDEAATVKHPLHNFEDLARRVAGVLAFVAGLWALLSIWHVDDTMNISNSFMDSSLDVVVILFIGYIVYHAFRIWIDTKIEDEGGDEIEVTPGDEGGGSGASRLATLLPLFRNFILVIVVVTIGLIVLLQMGINVSPLFAGAGIVGLAIGFGSQTLVRDIFSGAFFLVDDAFRKGEYIDAGNVRGTVEKISVRSFQLRHHLGPLHTIPFGEIQVLTNYSRDWVMMKLPLRVTYDTDVEKVRKLIKKLGLDLLEDPIIGGNFLQPLKSQGVIEMQDSAMIIRVKFMTKPGDQWVIRKRVFQEIRDLFALEGIKFAHREVTVRLADSDSEKDLTAAQKTAIAGAALSGIEEDQADAADQDSGE